MIAIETNTEPLEKAKHITEAMTHHATEYAKLAEELKSIDFVNLSVTVTE